MYVRRGMSFSSSEFGIKKSSISASIDFCSNLVSKFRLFNRICCNAIISEQKIVVLA